jgi:hypothetical protein
MSNFTHEQLKLVRCFDSTVVRVVLNLVDDGPGAIRNFDLGSYGNKGVQFSQEPPHTYTLCHFVHASELFSHNSAYNLAHSWYSFGIHGRESVAPRLNWAYWKWAFRNIYWWNPLQLFLSLHSELLIQNHQRSSEINFVFELEFLCLMKRKLESAGGLHDWIYRGSVIGAVI